MKNGVTTRDCLFPAVILVIIFLMASCTSSKHITTHEVNQDSLVIKEKTDSIRVLSSQVERLQQEVNELQYAEVLFDTVFVPGDTVFNTLVITKDGDVSAKGNIKSATVSKTVWTKIVQEKQNTIDSISAIKQKEIVRVVTEYKDKEVVKKVTIFPWWFWLITGLFAFLWVRKQFLLR